MVNDFENNNFDLKYQDRNGIQVALESSGYLVVRFRGQFMFDCETSQEAIERVEQIKQKFNFK